MEDSSAAGDGVSVARRVGEGVRARRVGVGDAFAAPLPRRITTSGQISSPVSRWKKRSPSTWTREGASGPKMRMG
jgi:hypothetical protein